MGKWRAMETTGIRELVGLRKRPSSRRSVGFAALLSLAVSAVVVATPPAARVAAQTTSPIETVDDLYAAVAAGSTPIVLAATTFLLDEPLVITADDTQIVGAAQPVSYDALTGAVTAGAATLIDAAGSGQAIVVEADGVEISGVAITGGDAGSKGSGGAIEVARNTTGFVLSDSTIVANTAGEGAGVFVERNATGTIERSTFVGNDTAGKGGGLRIVGSVDVVNSTFADNNAQSGGAMSVAGAATVSYSTFVDNTSNNSKGGGVDRNGGTLVVTGSILTQANQQTSDGSDCSGTPDLVGVNYVGNDQGCNPGSGTLTRATVGPLAIEALADNGGPTQTIAQLEGSPGVDITGLTNCL